MQWTVDTIDQHWYTSQLRVHVCRGRPGSLLQWRARSIMSRLSALMWDVFDSNNLLLLIHANYGLVSCVVPFLNCSYTCRGRNWRRVKRIADALSRRTPKSSDYFVSLAKLPSWCSAVYYGMYKGLRKHHIWNASSLSSRLWSLSKFLRRTGTQAEHTRLVIGLAPCSRTPCFHVCLRAHVEYCICMSYTFVCNKITSNV